MKVVNRLWIADRTVGGRIQRLIPDATIAIAMRDKQNGAAVRAPSGRQIPVGAVGDGDPLLITGGPIVGDGGDKDLAGAGPRVSVKSHPAVAAGINVEAGAVESIAGMIQ